MAVAVESHKRSIIKTVTWRFIATSVTLLVSYAWLGEWTSAIALALTANVIKTLLYYIHERTWTKVSWGCIKHPLSKIPVKGELKPEDMALIQRKLKELGYVD